MLRKGNVLAIMSAKGGTGKTSTVANLAAALSTEFSRKILAIDTNITTASLGIHFGIDYPKVTMYDVLKRNYPIESAVFNYDEKLHVIPASLKSFEIEKNDNFFTFPDKIRKLVDHYDILLTKIAKKYDLVLLDSAPGFNFEAVAAMQVADGVLFVANPDYPSIIATAKAIAYAKNLCVPMGGVVLNRVTKKNYELSDSDVQELTGAQVAAKIPLDDKIPESIAKGIPVTLYKPHSIASIFYKKLAGLLIGEDYYMGLRDKLKTLIRKI